MKLTALLIAIEEGGTVAFATSGLIEAMRKMKNAGEGRPHRRLCRRDDQARSPTGTQLQNRLRSP